MRRENWKVIEGDNRPAGAPDRCFYCGVPHGGQHKEGCVIRTRTVVVRATFEYTVDVPEDWDQEMIEFQRNEGSWCADNGIGELNDLSERLDKAGACACAAISYEYVREATEEDEAASAWPVDPHQS